jgi:hypothetical protein
MGGMHVSLTMVHPNYTFGSSKDQDITNQQFKLRSSRSINTQQRLNTIVEKILCRHAQNRTGEHTKAQHIHVAPRFRTSENRSLAT